MGKLFGEQSSGDDSSVAARARAQAEKTALLKTVISLTERPGNVHNKQLVKELHLTKLDSPREVEICLALADLVMYAESHEWNAVWSDFFTELMTRLSLYRSRLGWQQEMLVTDKDVGEHRVVQIEKPLSEKDQGRL